MTPKQSKQLKVGDRVCFNGDKIDRGMVTANNGCYVTIKWEGPSSSRTKYDANQPRR